MLALAVLVLPLLAPGATPCLRCWPDAAPYVPYDVGLLLGAAQPGGVVGLEKKLSALVLGRDPGVGVMERERLEREAGKLFYHLDQIITRNLHDPSRLMKEAQLEKQNFTRRLRVASAAVQQQVCGASCGRPQPFDLAECSNCRRFQAQCRDPRVCSGASVTLAVGLSLGALLGAGAAVGRRVGSKEAKEGLAAGGSEPPTDQDGRPTDQEDEPPTDQRDGAPTDQDDEPPTDQRDGAPTDQEDEPPMDPGDRPPADHGDGTLTHHEGPPADQGDGAPTHQDGFPVDQGDRAPMEGGQNPTPRA